MTMFYLQKYFFSKENDSRAYQLFNVVELGKARLKSDADACRACGGAVGSFWSVQKNIWGLCADCEMWMSRFLVWKDDYDFSVENVCHDYGDCKWSHYRMPKNIELKTDIENMKALGSDLRGAYFFCGSQGVGKTMLAMLLLKDFIRRGLIKYDKHCPHPQFYLTTNNIRNYTVGDGSSIGFLNHLKDARVLVIDEIGKDLLQSDYHTSIMHDVVNYRLELNAKKCLTIFISNTTLDENKKYLKENEGGARFLAGDREKLFYVLNFQGASNNRKEYVPDWRVKNGKENKKK